MLFFFNDTATTEIYTLSLHDALPICKLQQARAFFNQRDAHAQRSEHADVLDTDHSTAHDNHGFVVIGVEYVCMFATLGVRSEEHTSELQSPDHLVCRLLLEKKNKISQTPESRPERLPSDGQAAGHLCSASARTSRAARGLASRTAYWVGSPGTRLHSFMYGR